MCFTRSSAGSAPTQRKGTPIRACRPPGRDSSLLERPGLDSGFFGLSRAGFLLPRASWTGFWPPGASCSKFWPPGLHGLESSLMGPPGLDSRLLGPPGLDFAPGLDSGLLGLPGLDSDLPGLLGWIFDSRPSGASWELPAYLPFHPCPPVASQIRLLVTRAVSIPSKICHRCLFVCLVFSCFVLL